MPSSVEPGNRVGISGRLVPLLARILIRTVTGTMRIQCVGSEIFKEQERLGRRAVFPLFHGRMFLIAGFLRGRKLVTIASLSSDGELAARVMAGLGFRVVRGSDSRAGARGLIGMKRIMEQGYYATFTVDGPRGPRHEVKPGAVYIAKKSGVAIIPLAASACPASILRTWDRYMVPWPFARGVFIFGDPIYLDDDISEEAMTRDRRLLQRKMLELQEQADRMTGLKTGDR